MLYPIAIENGDDHHAYGVTVPDLPGCFSAGDTLEEAVNNAKEAITGHIELLIELGDDIPAVSSLSALVADSQYAGYTWALVDVDLARLLGGTEKINVTLPKSLIDRIDRCVATHPEFKSRSGFLAQVAIERIAKGV
ncbi:type II toxin-antitoxin system HicB family antitoxin [Erwinia billingiae]|uniref:type II toxin-antitoxin system HicB family antitoxin n=1 Tax=Erwinia billingiae TaxID=182337 RepID=UPI0012468B81|nr:type II toxin-antitoxin system HicB family antitoxin [Erwinia billingiae]QEW31472.1 type II toxin-antitoxin system HicB family antitoxin [Erwinia billingiae]